MRLTDYINYFEQVATKLKAIGHQSGNVKFLSVDIEEIASESLRNTVNMNSPVMLLECFEGQWSDRLSDNVQEYAAGAFWILRNVKISDHAQRIAAIDECSVITEKVLSKIRLDRQNAHAMMRGFDFGSVKRQKVGPIFDHAFGLRCEFTIIESVQGAISYNPDDWYA